MPRRNINIFVVSLVLMVFGTFAGAWYLLAKENNTQIRATEIIGVQDALVAESLTVSPVPTPIPQPQQETQEHISPDGLIMVLVERTGSSYEVSVRETESPSEEEVVFSGQLAEGQNVEIPFNTWSPDNKYFFLKQSQGEDVSFLVFKASGEGFGTEEETQPFLNVSAQFVEQEIPHELRDVTGWAGIPVLLVQTDGPSYWYNVQTQRFVVLATEF